MRALAFLAALLASPAIAQESVVTGLSTDNIAITADFDGSEIFVFGAVRRDGPGPVAEGPLDIIITLKGPPQPLMVRRKERVAGVWVNTQGVRVAQAPSFYAVAATRAVEDILSQTERLRYGIGMEQAVRRVGGHPTITDTSPFADAVVRIRERNGLYAVLDGGVRLIEDTLFQAHFALPANLVEGQYLAEFFLVRERGRDLRRLDARHGAEGWAGALDLQPLSRAAARLRRAVDCARATLRLAGCGGV
jgi:uncharacterized protein (TIGR02186 family)